MLIIVFKRIVKALLNLKALLGNHIFNFESTVYNEIQSILTTDQYAKLLLVIEKVPSNNNFYNQ